MTASTRASEFVSDTVGIVTRVEKRRLGTAAKFIFESFEAGAITIYIPGMVFAEIMYLSERRRISTTIQDIRNYLNRFSNWKECPMSLAVVQSAADITDIPELHDRLIAGTARSLDLELITNDQIMQASSFVKTVW